MSPEPRTKVSGFDRNLPLDKATAIPACWYLDEDIYSLERRQVFAHSWLAAGRSEQVPDPGSYFTTEVAGEPILVLRDKQNTLRAFANVCRHRAAPVMNEAAGKASRLRCRYHGWTYDLDGRLLGTPEFGADCAFERSKNGLVEYAVDTWGPYVWVYQHSLRPPVSLEEYLAPFPEKVAGLGIESLRFVQRREYDLACNWKVYVDNFLDGGYHVNTVHPALAGVIDYTRYRTVNDGKTSVQISPLSAKPGSEKARSVRGGEIAYYWWIYPNFMLNWYQGLMDVDIVLPLGPNRCRVIFDFYFADTEGPAAQKFIAESIEVAHQVQLEDLTICEEVQGGMASRSYRPGPYCPKRETGQHHFHCLVAKDLQRPAD
jgi:choline monooxygenase